MEEYHYLLDLALILFTTKLFGLISQKFKMPQVVGALLAGLILGPAVLNIVQKSNFITTTSEIGVIILMFCAGLETDVKELKKCGKASFVIALLGVIVPLLGGFGVAYFFNQPGIIDSGATCNVFLQNVFIGVILTATSVSITVETLKELGSLKSESGNAILGAAIIDDILGIIALTVITSLADSSVNVWIVLLKILGFFAMVVVAGFAFYKLYVWWANRSKHLRHRHAIICFVFCLGMSYAAEALFGVADITGAFFAGLIISLTQSSEYLAKKFDVLSYLLLSPIFFASIGLNVVLPSMSVQIIVFAVVITIVAIITKVIGCGLGAKICGYKNYQCKRIGIGMISRGEVALIVANKGASMGLLGSVMLGPIVIMVIATTIITPILLKIVYSNKKTKNIDETIPAENTINSVTERIQDSYVNEVVNAEVPEIPLSDKKIGSNKKVK